MIGIAASTLAIPNAMIERIDVHRDVERTQEDPQRGCVEQPVERRPEATRPSSCLSLISCSSRSATRCSTIAALSSSMPELAGDPTNDALRATLALHQPEDERASQTHHDHARQRGRSVDRVDATYRDRHDQSAPQDQVEHDGRPQTDGREGEAGIGARHAGERHQPVAERRAEPRCRRARCSTAHACSSGSGTDASATAVRAGVTERRLHQRCVAVERDQLERQPDAEQDRLDPTQLRPCVAEVGISGKTK